MKEYLYKVYTSAGVYIGIWGEVTSTFNPTEEINTAGSDLLVELARAADDFGEGVDVDFDLNVKVYCIDDEAPTGTLVFNGFISSYAPVFGSDERIEVILKTYGAKADSQMIQSGETLDDSNTVVSDYTEFGYLVPKIQQPVTPISDLELGRLELKVDLSSVAPDIDTGILKIYQGTPTGAKTLIGTATKVISEYASEDLDEWSTSSFVFSTPIPLVAGGEYFFSIETEANLLVYNLAIQFRDTGGPGFYLVDQSDIPYLQSGRELWFKMYGTTGNTTAAYNSVDPSTILMDIIDDYRNRGGELDYDGTTIDLTGTVVSYEFNTNTVWEGFQKCLEMAPAGWYLYIDQATNMVHFHEKANATDLWLNMGEHITDLKADKRTDDIINTIFFTGGGTPPLFKKIQNDGSIELFGVKAKRHIDERVTDDDTAEIIATGKLKPSAELRLSFTLVDSGIDPVNGFDLESIVLGSMVSLRNIGAGGSSLYDVAYYDVDYYDYNIKDLSTPILQIVRIERSPVDARIFCSTTMPEVAKRVEDINRNLEAAQTVDNPDTPS